jgi:hypothetical protein
MAERELQASENFGNVKALGQREFALRLIHRSGLSVAEESMIHAANQSPQWVAVWIALGTNEIVTPGQWLSWHHRQPPQSRCGMMGPFVPRT